MATKRPLRDEVDELRSIVAVQATIITSLIGALGPDFGSVMCGIIAALPEQEAFQSLSPRERRIFARELEKFRTSIDPSPHLH